LLLLTLRGLAGRLWLVDFFQYFVLTLYWLGVLFLCYCTMGYASLEFLRTWIFFLCFLMHETLTADPTVHLGFVLFE
jgi:hypothetical protein